MPEIKTTLTVFHSDDDGGEYWLIEPKHTLRDILRHVLNETGDKDEFLYLATELFNEAD